MAIVVVGAVTAPATTLELLAAAKFASDAVITSCAVGMGTLGMAPEAEVMTGAAAAVWVTGLVGGITSDGMENSGGIIVAGVAAGVDAKAVCSWRDGGAGV